MDCDDGRCVNMYVICAIMNENATTTLATTATHFSSTICTDNSDTTPELDGKGDCIQDSFRSDHLATIIDDGIAE